ncbi:TPA: hypothetical protein RUZ63_002749 [Vibrio cholerae]|uniref:Uncharacterized protein n=1 Tax=Vibrio paracholerae TaxID=650003 RepID=A0ABD7FU92_9VIBR|nr:MULTISPECIES: hypothetical protein [Vibrio]EFH74823.1 predicted protein [Vibrio cholerae RC385]EGR1858305.1 hypothetical protein [Vibrio cholerae]EGR3964568.1 hypothetical protein [Vibrio cholerae]EJL6522757.1 hypothetical protein [Vibrio cholerae]EKF9371982.1 hypothetical protein [Vibrio cholerae]
MIIFDAASVLYIAQFLDSHHIHLNGNVYFDDRKKKRLVLSVERMYEDFDVSGMFMNVLSGYKLIFADAELRLFIRDAKMEFYDNTVTEFTRRELEDEVANWVHTDINENMF